MLTLTGVTVFCIGISGRRLWYTVGNLGCSFGVIVLVATEVVQLTVWVTFCIRGDWSDAVVHWLLFGVVGLEVVCWSSCIPLGLVSLFICGIFVVAAGAVLFSWFMVL